MENENHSYSPEEDRNLTERARDDGDLINNGAEFKNGVLQPTEKQMENMLKKMDIEMSIEKATEDVTHNTDEYLKSPEGQKALEQINPDIKRRILDRSIQFNVISCGGKNGDQLIEELKINRNAFGYGPSQELSSLYRKPYEREFNPTPPKEDSPIVILNPEMLDIDEGTESSGETMTKAILDRAKEFGLEPCPIDAAANFALQCGETLDPGQEVIFLKDSTIDFYRPTSDGLPESPTALVVSGEKNKCASMSRRTNVIGTNHLKEGYKFAFKISQDKENQAETNSQ